MGEGSPFPRQHCLLFHFPFGLALFQQRLCKTPCFCFWMFFKQPPCFLSCGSILFQANFKLTRSEVVCICTEDVQNVALLSGLHPSSLSVVFARASPTFSNMTW